MVNCQMSDLEVNAELKRRIDGPKLWDQEGSINPNFQKMEDLEAPTPPPS